MLDHARELGFNVEVSDEGRFFEERDVHKLCKAVEVSSEALAAIAGALKDAVADPRAVQSPILGSGDFERMEQRGRQCLNPELLALILSLCRRRRTEAVQQFVK